MDWESLISTLTLSETVWGLVGLALTWLLGFVWSFLRKQGIEQEAIDNLRTAVAQVGDDFVVWRKRANEDGKLTAEERTQARTLAVNKGKDLATGPAFRLLTKWGTTKLDALVSRLVQGEKK